MAAQFVYLDEQVRIISNTMSIINAGFHPCRSYYDKTGDKLQYFKDDAGRVIARISRRRHQPIIWFFNSTDEANQDFKRRNEGKTFQTGKWVPEK